MTQAPLARIRSLSRKMKLLVVLSAVGLAGALGYLVWLAAVDIDGLKALIARYPLSGTQPLALSARALVGLAALAVANGLLIGAGIWTLWAIFDHFEKGDIFSERSGVLLRRTGYLALIGGISSLLSRTLAILVATYDNPPGQKMLSLGISSTDIGLFILAGLLFVLGHIMVIAAQIEADNRSFV